jgi:hypothetical protein
VAGGRQYSSYAHTSWKYADTPKKWSSGNLAAITNICECWTISLHLSRNPTNDVSCESTNNSRRRIICFSISDYEQTMILSVLLKIQESIVDLAHCCIVRQILNSEPTDSRYLLVLGMKHLCSLQTGSWLRGLKFNPYRIECSNTNLEY